MAPRLSHLITPGTTCSISTSLNQLCIHTICCAHLDIATYSASTVDKATVACLLLLQATAPPAIMKTYPDVERRVSLHPLVMKEGLGTRGGVRERVWRVRVQVTKAKPSSNPYPFWRVTGLCRGSASRQPPAGYNSHSYS